MWRAMCPKNEVFSRYRQHDGMSEGTARKQAPKRLACLLCRFVRANGVFEIKEDGRFAMEPAEGERFLRSRRDKEPFVEKRPEPTKSGDKSWQVTLEPRAIHDPHHVLVELLTRSAFIGAQMRVLEFNR